MQTKTHSPHHTCNHSAYNCIPKQLAASLVDKAAVLLSPFKRPIYLVRPSGMLNRMAGLSALPPYGTSQMK
jgi:hypothetical protein